VHVYSSDLMDTEMSIQSGYKRVDEPGDERAFPSSSRHYRARSSSSERQCVKESAGGQTQNLPHQAQTSLGERRLRISLATKEVPPIHPHFTSLHLSKHSNPFIHSYFLSNYPSSCLCLSLLTKRITIQYIYRIFPPLSHENTQ
jgi:hypothetical protein